MKSKTIFSATLLCVAAAGQCQAVITGFGYMPGVSPAPFLGGAANVIKGSGVSVSLPTPTAGFNILLPNTTDWTPYTHLQVRLQNTGPRAEPFFIAVASTGLWVFSEVTLQPNEDGTVIIPLDNSVAVGAYRLPQPPASTAYQLSAGSTADKPNVRWLCVRAPNESASASLLIRDMRPITAPIPTSNLVDAYGQQNQISWPGKVTSDADMVNAIAARPVSGVYPFAADLYGGVAGTAVAGSNTGRWHTLKQGSTWYIIDPLGNRFFSAGVTQAASPSNGIVTGRESQFASGALPSQTGPFAQHYHTMTWNGYTALTYCFYTSNIQRRVGSSWPSVLMSETTARMRSWGFNTVGASGSDDFRLASSQTTYTINATVHGSFAWIPDPSGVPMPDIFDPAWSTAVQTSLASEIATIGNPSYNMGMFVDNELPWARSFTTPNYQFGLFEDILMAPATQPAKIQLVQWLTNRYGNNIAGLNSAWGSSFASFSAILTAQTAVPQSPTSAMSQDMNAFTLNFARTYFTTVRQKLNTLGYTGIYLGCRFLSSTPEVLQACKESADVISYNSYETTPWKYNEAIRALDAPVLISEAGFGACDLGRTCFWPNILTENDRASFIKSYYGAGLSWPNLVGIHWYKWEDDVISGRYYDGNNCCTGLVSITDIPYWPTVDAVTNYNAAFHSRLKEAN